MTDTAILAVLLAGGAGLLAGRAWAAARRRGGASGRPSFRTSAHYTQGLHYLTAGRFDLAVSELTKVVREDPDAIEVLQVLGTLLCETGQVERAIEVHQGLLARNDLTRAERSHAMAALGTDFRRAGFLDRATSTLESVLERDPKNLHALLEMQRLYQEQRRWREAYDIRLRLARLRKGDDNKVLGHLQAEIGREALERGDRVSAERAFRAASSLDREVFPALLGLADLYATEAPAKTVAVLEDAIRASPDRAYLVFDRLALAYSASGEATRFVRLCEDLIRHNPREWRARLALAKGLTAEGKPEEALGLLLRALETNPQVLLLHFEAWRLLQSLRFNEVAASSYLAVAERSMFYRDPHLCTACRYRADGMLWRCPHCHEWSTFVEERQTPAATG